MSSLYSKLLEKGKDAIAALERPFKVEKEKKNLEMKILDLKQTLATDELTIQEQMSSHPVDWDKLIEAIDRKEVNQRKLKQLETLEMKMFIEEVTDE